MFCWISSLFKSDSFLILVHMFFPFVFIIIIILFRVIFADIFCMSCFTSLFLLFHWIGLVVQYLKNLFYSCCCCSVAKSCLTLQFYGLQHARLLSLSFTISRSLLKLMSIESVRPSDRLILCQPLLLLTSSFPKIRIFANTSTLCIRWPKYWSFSFSISLSNEYSRLIFFKIDWFALLAVQGTFKSLLQHHSLKASILHHSALFMVHFSHLYMTTGKTIALTILFLWSLLTKDPWLYLCFLISY